MKYLLLCLTCLLALAGCQDTPENSTEVAPATSTAPESSSETVATTAVPAPAPATGTPTVSTPEAAQDVDLKTILAHHNFVIKSFNGKDFPTETPDGKKRARPNLDFGQWPQAGGRICNSFGGQVEVKGNTLTMPNAVTTMMLCPEPELDQLERAFHELLAKGAEVEFKDQALTLKGPNTVLVYTLSDYM